MTDTPPQDTAVWQVHLPQFEGPFDLLLFFIQRDELDIYDIPISRITDDFLKYLHSLDALRIEVAAEFIAMAAMLMKIKAAMLLPRPQLDAQGEPVDPRAELVDRLMEYRRYREVFDWFRAEEDAAADRFTRPPYEAEWFRGLPPDPQDELQGVTLVGLMKVYHRLLQQQHVRDAPPRHVVQPLPYTMEAVRDDLMDRITAQRKVHFGKLVERRPEKIFIVFSFLCILELIQQKAVQVVIGEGFNNFWLLAVDEAA